MLSVISPDWKVDRQEDWDHISSLVSCYIFQMLLGAKYVGSGQDSIIVLILSAELNMRENCCNLGNNIL